MTTEGTTVPSLDYSRHIDQDKDDPTRSNFHLKIFTSLTASIKIRHTLIFGQFESGLEFDLSFKYATGVDLSIDRDGGKRLEVRVNLPHDTVEGFELTKNVFWIQKCPVLTVSKVVEVEEVKSEIGAEVDDDDNDIFEEDVDNCPRYSITNLFLELIGLKMCTSSNYFYENFVKDFFSFSGKRYFSVKLKKIETVMRGFSIIQETETDGHDPIKTISSLTFDIPGTSESRKWVLTLRRLANLKEGKTNIEIDSTNPGGGTVNLIQYDRTLTPTFIEVKINCTGLLFLPPSGISVSIKRERVSQNEISLEPSILINFNNPDPANFDVQVIEELEKNFGPDYEEEDGRHVQISFKAILNIATLKDDEGSPNYRLLTLKQADLSYATFHFPGQKGRELKKILSVTGNSEMTPGLHESKLEILWGDDLGHNLTIENTAVGQPNRIDMDTKLTSTIGTLNLDLHTQIKRVTPQPPPSSTENLGDKLITFTVDIIYGPKGQQSRRHRFVDGHLEVTGEKILVNFDSRDVLDAELIGLRVKILKKSGSKNIEFRTFVKHILKLYFSRERDHQPHSLGSDILNFEIDLFPIGRQVILELSKIWNHHQNGLKLTGNFNWDGHGEEPRESTIEFESESNFEENFLKSKNNLKILDQNFDLYLKTLIPPTLSRQSLSLIFETPDKQLYRMDFENKFDFDDETDFRRVIQGHLDFYVSPQNIQHKGIKWDLRSINPNFAHLIFDLSRKVSVSSNLVEKHGILVQLQSLHFTNENDPNTRHRSVQLNFDLDPNHPWVVNLQSKIELGQGYLNTTSLLSIGEDRYNFEFSGESSDQQPGEFWISAVGGADLPNAEDVDYFFEKKLPRMYRPGRKFKLAIRLENANQLVRHNMDAILTSFLDDKILQLRGQGIIKTINGTYSGSITSDHGIGQGRVQTLTKIDLNPLPENRWRLTVRPTSAFDGDDNQSPAHVMINRAITLDWQKIVLPSSVVYEGNYSSQWLLAPENEPDSTSGGSFIREPKTFKLKYDRLDTAAADSDGGGGEKGGKFEGTIHFENPRAPDTATLQVYLKRTNLELGANLSITSHESEQPIGNDLFATVEFQLKKDKNSPLILNSFKAIRRIGKESMEKTFGLVSKATGNRGIFSEVSTIYNGDDKGPLLTLGVTYGSPQDQGHHGGKCQWAVDLCHANFRNVFHLSSGPLDVTKRLDAIRHGDAEMVCGAS